MFTHTTKSKLLSPALLLLPFLLLSPARSAFASPIPDPGCVWAYEHNDYGGARYGFCLSGGADTPHASWNDKISSIALPYGMKATFCEHVNSGQPGGLCRTYFQSVPSVGSMNDTYSYVTWGYFSPSDFTMAILSDTQYGYGPNPANANTNHSGSIQNLGNQVGFSNFAGLVLNGDITNTMDKEQIEQYENDYEHKSFNIYPGLGNHDYDNYIDNKWCDGYFMDGGEYRALSQNLCAVRLLRWFERRVASIPTSSADYSYNGEDLTGSLAYSFDVGAWHFVQLNNHPDYHRNIESYDSWNAVTRSFYIESALPWLEADLAANPTKNVVLNVHVMNASPFDFNSNPLPYEELGDIIDDNQQVVAIFAGHLHYNVGRNDNDPVYQFVTPRGRVVPVFFSGSAETNKYLKARFLTDRLEVQVVDSSSGDAQLVGSVMSTKAWAQISNRWQPDKFLQNEWGTPHAAPLGSLAFLSSAQWWFEPIAGTNFVRIRDRWTDNYLHIEYGNLALDPVGDQGWHSAQWSLVPVPGTPYVQISNRWKPWEYLHIEYGDIQCGQLGDPGWHSAQWLVD